MNRPISRFPGGVAGAAGRLISHLAKLGLPAVRVEISGDDRLVIRIGEAISAEELRGNPDAARLWMGRIQELSGVGPSTNAAVNPAPIIAFSASIPASPAYFRRHTFA